MRTLVVLLACLGVLVAGCDRGPESLHLVAAAAERTQAAGSLRYSLVSVTDAGTPDELTMLGEGVIHPAAERSWRRWEPEGGVFPDAEGPACPDDGNEVIQTPTTWYTLNPAWSACEPVWFELDMPRLRDEGVDLTPADVLGIGAVPTMEPMDALSYLRRAPGAVTEVGSEEARGDATTRYRLAAALVEGETIDVWVDGRGHVRRIRFDGEPRTVLELYDVGSAPLPPLQPEGPTRPGDFLLELYAQPGD